MKAVPSAVYIVADHIGKFRRNRLYVEVFSLFLPNTLYRAQMIHCTMRTWTDSVGFLKAWKIQIKLINGSSNWTKSSVFAFLRQIQAQKGNNPLYLF